ncbi:MAG: winged helix-turn-helix transcriptional regulator [Ruminococcaceae bacterium]|nr:winged helix-turn-helix transcriptional regulator [Oscillospiraceae bacterium]
MQSEQTVGFMIKTLSNLFARNISGHKCDITRVQGWVIGFLYRSSKEGKQIFQRDIEEHFQIRRSTATGILKGMEKNGLIKKEPVPGDARLKRLLLSDYAIGLHENFIAEIRRLDTIAQAGLSQTEIDAFLTTAQKMIDNLKAAEAKKQEESE